MSGALRLASSQPSRIFTVTGTRRGVDRRLDDAERQVGLAHQRRAGIAVRHPLGRAAHVDVDDVARRPPPRPARPRAIQRARGRRAGRHATSSPSPSAAQARLFRRRGAALRRRPFGHDEARAEALRRAAERQVGDAGHRREEGAAWDGTCPISGRTTAQALRIAQTIHHHENCLQNSQMHGKRKGRRGKASYVKSARPTTATGMSQSACQRQAPSRAGRRGRPRQPRWAGAAQAVRRARRQAVLRRTLEALLCASTRSTTSRS